MSIRVRFAPSPTGGIHIGGLRTALFNYLYAKKYNGHFVLRIEDTDNKRRVVGAENYILDSLQWLGIEPDEGPNYGGDYGPYKQSERKSIYEKEIIKLIKEGKAYYAFDSTESLDKLRKKYESDGKKFKYDSFTRNSLFNSLSLSEKETKEKIKEGGYVIRLKVEAGKNIDLFDEIRGKINVKSEEIDDKILVKANGIPTYHFANVIDDHYMKISHVIRGEEWLPSLPLHKLIYDAFNWSPPKFLHLPLILKPRGKGKLSKRDGDDLGFPVFPLKWEKNKGFKERGFLPEALLNYMSLLGWSPGTEKEIFMLKELIYYFDIKKIQKGGARFDFEKARWINHKFLLSTDPKVILKRFPGFFRGLSTLSSKKNKLAVYELVKERLFLLEDFETEARLFFHDPNTYDEKVVNRIKKNDPKKILKFLIDLIDKKIQAKNWKEYFSKWSNKETVPIGQIMQSLRLAIIGNLSGPDILKVCGLLEKEVILRRLRKLINYLNK